MMKKPSIHFTSERDPDLRYHVVKQSSYDPTNRIKRGLPSEKKFNLAAVQVDEDKPSGGENLVFQRIPWIRYRGDSRSSQIRVSYTLRDNVRFFRSRKRDIFIVLCVCQTRTVGYSVAKRPMFPTSASYSVIHVPPRRIGRERARRFVYLFIYSNEGFIPMF